MEYAELLAEERRLVVLRVLDTAGTANDSVLTTAIVHIGVPSTRDQVRTAMRWLEEQGLVEIEALEGGRVLKALLTERGLEVAQGRALCPGVKRPTRRS